MSPQILLIVAVVIVVIALVAVALRPSGGRDTGADRPEKPAEPGSEGMYVPEDGEISPGNPGDDLG